MRPHMVTEAEYLTCTVEGTVGRWSIGSSGGLWFR
jgi:hypothetical protein